MVFIHNRKSASDRLCKMSIMCDSNQCLSCPVKILQIPAACPVVPPGSGTLNIIPRNEKAAPIPRSGILTFGISVLTFIYLDFLYCQQFRIFYNIFYLFFVHFCHIRDLSSCIAFVVHFHDHFPFTHFNSGFNSSLFNFPA